MRDDALNDDLPVLRDDSLPVLLALGPEHDQAAPVHRGWSSIASQRQLRGIAAGKDGSVWLATRGGVLSWHHGMNRFTRYGSEHGLPGNAVTGVAIDDAGQAWATSEDGRLFWLDGEAWRPCLALAAERVTALAVDQPGRLWAATSGGLFAIDGPFAVSPAGGTFGGLAPRGLTVIDGSDAWVCTALGLHRLGAAGWAPLRPARGVVALARQGEGLWLGTAAALQRIDLAASAASVPAGNWPQGAVVALAAGTDGVWTAVHSRTGYEVGFATAASWIRVAGRALQERVVGLAPAGRDEVWIATDEGLALGSTAGVRWYQTEGPPEVIPVAWNRAEPLNNLIQALAIHARALWIGTACGLFRMGLADRRWYGFTRSDRLGDIRGIVPGMGADELWVAAGQDGQGGAGGLRLVRGRIPLIEQFAVPASVAGLVTGVGGAAWAVTGLDLGSLPDGLYRNDSAGWSLALSASELRSQGLAPGACLQAISQAQDGLAWIGTSGGLFAWLPGAAIARERSLGEPDVRAVLALADGTLVAGTAGGLYIGSPGHLAPAAGWSGQTVNALAWEVPAETLWCGTDAGLLRVERGAAGWRVAATSTAADSGLAADRVTALALSGDDAGARLVWAGTPSGISRYRVSV